MGLFSIAALLSAALLAKPNKSRSGPLNKIGNNYSHKNQEYSLRKNYFDKTTRRRP